MGLIKAAIGAAGGVLADQWKEFFTCDAIPMDILAVKGQKKVTGRSSNTKGDDNIISNGSVIAVADGQCMMIVEQGKVVEVCAEPGEYTYDASTEPSIFVGSLGEGIRNVFKNIGKRFTFGGEAPKDQRVYYFNTKELMGNKYGTPVPISIDALVSRQHTATLTIGIRCFGEYSYRISNPLLFYTNVCGNVDGPYSRENLEGQMKTELLTAMSPAFGRIAQQGIVYSDLTMHTMEMAEALNDVLSSKWRDLRGIEIVSFGLSSIRPDEESEKAIRQMQSSMFYSDPNLAGARVAAAQANAMETAAANPNGAVGGFMGMGMAGAMGGVNAQGLFRMGRQQRQAAPAGWTCACGTQNTGKFCQNCGSPKPSEGGWTCSCGAVNKGKFCAECGAKKPAGAAQYKCDKCGWEPEAGSAPPKFCPECGDVFDNNDLQE